MIEHGARAAGVGVDAMLPKEKARHAEAVGREKAEQSAPTLLILAAMAGAYIGFGATFAATVSVGLDTAVSTGFARLVGGLAFSLSYALAIVGGGVLVALVYWFVYLRPKRHRA